MNLVQVDDTRITFILERKQTTGVVVLKIGAVLFDLGDTLVKTWIPEVTYQSVLASLGIDRSVEELERAIAKTEEEFIESSYATDHGMARSLIQNIGKDGMHRLSRI